MIRIAAVLAACIVASCGDAKRDGAKHGAKHDGAWQRLPPGARIVAAGGLPDGRLWFAGGLRGSWLGLVDSSGHLQHVSVPIATVLDAAAAPSGDVWVAGVDDGALGIVRVGRDGAIAAHARVPYDVSGQTYDLAATSTGVVAAGVHNPLVSGLAHGWLVHVGMDGAVRAEHRLGTSGHGFLVGVASLADGGFAAVGKLDQEPRLVVAGSGGELRVHRLAASQEPLLASDLATLDGDLVLVGHTIERETSVELIGHIAVERRRGDTIRWARRAEVRVAHISEAIAARGEVVVLASTRSNVTGELLAIRIRGDGTITTHPLRGPAMSSMIDSTAFLFLGPDGTIHLLQVAPGDEPRFRVLPLDAAIAEAAP